ncbi:MAG: Bug family tripartite tricarboxylate transporter substrate binding protein [Xanthobacteraceae bacterium]|jgi:tripartite-type tricarboxylate transporter receptor subunit TctC
MKPWLAAAIACGGLCLGVDSGAAQPYPAKPIHIVVASAPGGVTDLLGRSLAVELGRIFGQQVVIENRPGANSQIGAEFVAKSAPDGYTLLLAPETVFVVNPSLYAKLPYDPEKDFTPVAGLAMVQQALVIHPSLRANTVAELIALAKARPGELNYGCAGIGSASHLNMELFKLMTDVKLVGVHYRGATPALTDVIAGHVSAMFVNIGSVLEPWKAGRVRLLGIGTAARLPEFPDLPTVAESGVPGFEARSWFGLFAPSGTPRETVAKLNGEIQRIFSDSAYGERVLRPNALQPIAGSPEQYAALIKRDAEKWSKVIRAANIKPD